MVDEVIIPSMMMGAKYEDYLLGTAFARPIIAKRLVEIAKQEGADAICHAAPERVTIRSASNCHQALCPRNKDHCPLAGVGHQEPGRGGRLRRGPQRPPEDQPGDQLLQGQEPVHLSHEGLDLEDPANEPQYDKPGFLEMSVSPMRPPTRPPTSPWTLRRACPWQWTARR